MISYFILKHTETGRVRRMETGLWKGRAYRWFYEKDAAQNYLDENNLTDHHVVPCTAANLNKSYKK